MNVQYKQKFMLINNFNCKIPNKVFKLYFCIKKTLIEKVKSKIFPNKSQLQKFPN